ncbi:NAD(P)H-dependent oxidoreductase [Paucihalobacter ruber]|uniref:NAD(P)H-dependent oxidoreductase n=1 Tax=Paucihalobacter ruber TaxID=2567861 RepID=A0A506PJF0_9FLAO|nr:NAD(P)H-dependent oxidoreductase [Paucihalobacter ruber]TPV33237.1 NAD(P)H-dependent oxidoreductase [Paucihalobacter ruber]
MNTIDKLKWRYATKKFDTTKKLSYSQINTLKEAFNLTATSYGLQTMKLIVLEDSQKRNDILPAAYNQKQVVDASHLLVICIQNEVSGDDVDSYYKQLHQERQTPNEILEPYKNQLKGVIQNMSEANREEWTIRQAYIALGNLMTVCAFESIDSCPMEGFIPSEVDRILNLNDFNLKSVLLLPVGFRAENDMFASLKKVRKPLNEVILEL